MLGRPGPTQPTHWNTAMGTYTDSKRIKIELRKYYFSSEQIIIEKSRQNAKYGSHRYR